MNQPTQFPEVNNILDMLLRQMRAILGNDLVGVYLYGSLVTGDFDLDISDIDLLIALSHDLNDTEFAALEKMHSEVVRAFPAWDNRLELAYLAQSTLQTFKTQSGKIGIISPGEPFHIVEGGRLWLPNWYVVRQQGITLYGPPPSEVIAPISTDEFLEVIKDHVRNWRGWMDHVDSRPYQAYAILTMCRAFYTLRHGEQVSKLRAATWTVQELPEWADTIHNALAWRRDYRNRDIDDDLTQAETHRFVDYMVEKMVG